MTSLVATRHEDAQLRERVLLHLRRRYGEALSAEDREDLYQEAWACAAAYRERGGEIANLRAFLKTAADRRALDLKRRWREVTVDPDDPLVQLLIDDRPGPEERAQMRIDGATVWRIAASLSELELAVLEKRYWQGLAPKEVVAELGIDRSRFNRTIASAVAKVGNALSSHHQWVESHRDLLVRCVSNTATEAELARAITLVRNDPKASALLRELRAATDAAAAIAPVPGLVAAKPDSTTLAEHAVAALQSAKSHATGLFSRATDPTPLAAVRPGAATAAIAGCLAIGGGATYCATEGIPDPLKPVFGVELPSREVDLKPERPKRSPVAEVPTPTALPTPPPPESEPAVAPAPAEVAPAPAPSAPPPPEPVVQAREFGPEQAAPSSGGSAESFSAPAPVAPAPSGSGGGGGSAEFGP